MKSRNLEQPTLVFTVTNDLTYDQRMMRICGALAGRYRVLLVGRRLPESRPLEDAPYEQIRLRCRFRRGKLFYAEYNVRLFLFLLARPFDLVCSIDLDTILPGFFASRLKGTAFVYDAHEVFTEIPELANRPLVRRAWLAIERYVVPRVRYAYTVNESLAEIFRRRYGVRFGVIRNVPRRASFDARPGGARAGPAAGSPRPSILYQGVLNVGRGLEALVDAMCEVEADLVLIGEGDISRALRDRVRERGLDAKVRFLGFVPPRELPALIREATVAVNLRERLGLNDYYSLGNKFFDYVHAGVPQITMSFPEYARMNAHFEVAVLIDDLREETIRGAIASLLDDPARHARLRANCLAARDAINWERESEALLDIYARILADA